MGVVGAVRSRCRTSGRLTRGGGRARAWEGTPDLRLWGRSRIVILEGGDIGKPLPSNLARSPDSPPQVSAAPRCIRVGGGVSPLPPTLYPNYGHRPICHHSPARFTGIVTSGQFACQVCVGAPSVCP